jgi:hypothetical protein
MNLADEPTYGSGGDKMPDDRIFHIAVAEPPPAPFTEPAPANIGDSAREDLERQVSCYYRYEDRNPDAVRKFLIRRPDVAQTLVDTSHDIRRIFGETTTRLWMTNMDGEDCVAAWIECRRSVEESVDRMQEFDLACYTARPSAEFLPLIFHVDVKE